MKFGEGLQVLQVMGQRGVPEHGADNGGAVRGGFGHEIAGPFRCTDRVQQ